MDVVFCDRGAPSKRPGLIPIGGKDGFNHRNELRDRAGPLFCRGCGRVGAEDAVPRLATANDKLAQEETKEGDMKLLCITAAAVSALIAGAAAAQADNLQKLEN